MPKHQRDERDGKQQFANPVTLVTLA